MTTLEEAQYCSIRSFRRDGRAVDTPVWFAPGDGRFFFFSAGAAGKVKRLRNNSRMEVAPCDVRGKVIGEWQAGNGTVLVNTADIARAHAALRRKYGWVMWVFDLGSRLGGKFNKRAYVSFELGS
jgi:PPOX class probable F420-dependent enzyme